MDLLRKIERLLLTFLKLALAFRVGCRLHRAWEWGRCKYWQLRPGC